MININYLEKIALEKKQDIEKIAFKMPTFKGFKKGLINTATIGTLAAAPTVTGVIARSPVDLHFKLNNPARSEQLLNSSGKTVAITPYTLGSNLETRLRIKDGKYISINKPTKNSSPETEYHAFDQPEKAGFTMRGEDISPKYKQLSAVVNLPKNAPEGVIAHELGHADALTNPRSINSHALKQIAKLKMPNENGETVPLNPYNAGTMASAIGTSGIIINEIRRKKRLRAAGTQLEKDIINKQFDRDGRAIAGITAAGSLPMLGSELEASYLGSKLIEGNILNKATAFYGIPSYLNKALSPEITRRAFKKAKNIDF